ncbi:MAG TPA: SRPBCC family protein [Acidimicrobiales bacterium]|nr:SRPBCC family protein [Acidimicrobiales bacterium]
MELRASTELRASPAEVFAVVSDLATYPSWLGIVLSADACGGDAWTVELGARLGPLRRTKRVRMVRVEHDPEAGAVRFERQEEDGREHAPWVLAAALSGNTTLTMDLRYGGGRWLPGLDLVLREEVRRAGNRLQRLLDGAREDT